MSTSEQFSFKDFEAEQTETDEIVETSPAVKVKRQRKSSAKTEELRKAILRLLKENRSYTSREIVLALGRTPGAAEGGPVVRMLKKLEAENIVMYASAEEYNGYVWMKR